MRMILIILVIMTILLTACNRAVVDDSSLICPAVYEPVCNNGITYSNSCEAEKAGIMNYVTGECFEENEPLNETIIELECNTIYNPVCGSNGLTYSNSCEAQRDGIIDYTMGRCVVEEVMEGCGTLYEPVCGQNSQGLLTYTNLCFLNIGNATFMYSGECRTISNEIEYYENVDYSVDVDYFDGLWQYEVYIEKPTPCHMVDISRYFSENLTPKEGVIHFRIVEPTNTDCGAYTRIEQRRGFFESDMDTIIKMYLEGNLIYDNS